MNIEEYSSSRIARDDARIRNEKAASRIALLMYRYRTISWCPENIKSHVSLTEDELKCGLDWMRKKKYIAGTTMIFLTDSGIEFVAGLRENVSVSSAASESRYKDEALTGMCERRSKVSGYMVSEKSELTAAVIPTVKKPHTSVTPEDIIDEQRRFLGFKERIARQLNCTLEEIEHYSKTGRLRYCSSCESWKLFNRKGPTRWQPHCKECLKGKRR